VHASVLHCLAAARAPAVPWIASVSYGPLESEAQSVIRGLQSLGAMTFAAGAHRWFSERIADDGRLTTGYTLIGTGWHLWTLGEYDALFHDDTNMRALAPATVRACRWIMTQRRKSMRRDAHGEKLPAYGLMPPGPLADWNVDAFYFYANANDCAGLRDAAAALARVQDPNAAEIAADAREYSEEILRAFRFARARSPVIALRDGRCVPFAPTQVDAYGPIDELYPGEDAGRSWCYDVEVGASQLIALGFLDPHSREAGWMVDTYEDVEFLRDGWFAFPAAQNARDPFTFGGFAKVQPYYARTVETHALRDDVEPFLRSYFNTIPTLLNREDLSLWEHFTAHGAWNKTHETGYFLYQTRTLLLTERGDELWLAPFVPREWFADGRHLSVQGAPTRFGPVGYRIESRLAEHEVDVTLDPPTRTPPRAIVLRVRAPDRAPIRSVTADGREITTFDPERETIRLAPSAAAIRLVVRY